eukprot:gene6473-8903_t
MMNNSTTATTALVQTVKVVVRTRPTQANISVRESQSLQSSQSFAENREEINGSQAVIIDEANSSVNFRFLKERKGQADFRFSHVFGPKNDQKSLYSVCNVIDDVVEGINCCIMAYGQTGSGKTFTMYGQGWDELNATSLSNNNQPLFDDNNDDNTNDNNVISSSQNNDEELLGIIPRSIADLFSTLDERTTLRSKSFDFSVHCQIMQIYNEKIYDLLQDKKREYPLQLRESQKEGNDSIHVRGMSVFRIYSKEEAFQLLRKGLRNRAVRATDFNSESSRSHTILQLFVSVEDEDENGLSVLKRSTFSLVDLAGSEKWRSSLSQAGNAQVEVQREMTNINTSLHVLGNCVSALIESNRKHIPYRDSVLTRLLQDAISGTGRTVMIATIHEDPSYRDETYSTLQFASRASCIKVNLSANIGVNERIDLAEAQRQIKSLRNKLKDYQSQAQVTNLANNNNSNNNNSDALQLACVKCNEKDRLIETLKSQIQTLMEENNFLRTNSASSGPGTGSGPSGASHNYAIKSMIISPKNRVYNNNKNYNNNNDDDDSEWEKKSLSSVESMNRSYIPDALEGASSLVEDDQAGKSVRIKKTKKIKSVNNNNNKSSQASPSPNIKNKQSNNKKESILPSQPSPITAISATNNHNNHHNKYYDNNNDNKNNDDNSMIGDIDYARGYTPPKKYNSNHYSGNDAKDAVSKTNAHKGKQGSDNSYISDDLISSAIQAANAILSPNATSHSKTQSNSSNKITAATAATNSYSNHQYGANAIEDDANYDNKTSATSNSTSHPKMGNVYDIRDEVHNSSYLKDDSTSALHQTHTVKSSPVKPVTTLASEASGFDKNDGTCMKHGLDQCVLCNMFNSNSSAGNKSSNNAMNTITNSMDSRLRLNQGMNSNYVNNNNNNNNNTSVSSGPVPSSSGNRLVGVGSDSISRNNDSSSQPLLLNNNLRVNDNDETRRGYDDINNNNNNNNVSHLPPLQVTQNQAGNGVCDVHGVIDCLLCLLRGAPSTESVASMSVMGMRGFGLNYGYGHNSSVKSLDNSMMSMDSVGIGQDQASYSEWNTSAYHNNNNNAKSVISNVQTHGNNMTPAAAGHNMSARVTPVNNINVIRSMSRNRSSEGYGSLLNSSLSSIDSTDIGYGFIKENYNNNNNNNNNQPYSFPPSSIRRSSPHVNSAGQIGMISEEAQYYQSNHNIPSLQTQGSLTHSMDHGEGGGGSVSYPKRPSPRVQEIRSIPQTGMIMQLPHRNGSIVNNNDYDNGSDYSNGRNHNNNKLNPHLYHTPSLPHQQAQPQPEYNYDPYDNNNHNNRYNNNNDHYNNYNSNQNDNNNMNNRIKASSKGPPLNPAILPDDNNQSNIYRSSSSPLPHYNNNFNNNNNNNNSGQMMKINHFTGTRPGPLHGGYHNNNNNNEEESDEEDVEDDIINLPIRRGSSADSGRSNDKARVGAAANNANNYNNNANNNGLKKIKKKKKVRTVSRQGISSMNGVTAGMPQHKKSVK